MFPRKSTYNVFYLPFWMMLDAAGDLKRLESLEIVLNLEIIGIFSFKGKPTQGKSAIFLIENIFKNYFNR